MSSVPPYSPAVSNMSLENDRRYQEARELYLGLLDELPGGYDERKVAEFTPGDIERAVLVELQGVEETATIESAMKAHGML